MCSLLGHTHHLSSLLCVPNECIYITIIYFFSVLYHSITVYTLFIIETVKNINISSTYVTIVTSIIINLEPKICTKQIIGGKEFIETSGYMRFRLQPLE